MLKVADLVKAEEALSELEGLIAELVEKFKPYAERYRYYSLEYTWVLNKLRKRYFYYYLKSKVKNQKSIYLGSMPADYPICKQLNMYVKALEKLLLKIGEVRAGLAYVKAVSTLTMRIQEAERKMAEEAEKKKRRKGVR